MALLSAIPPVPTAGAAIGASPAAAARPDVAAGGAPTSPATELGQKLATRFGPGGTLEMENLPLHDARGAVALGKGPGWELHTDETATHSMIEAIGQAKTIVNAEFFGVSDAGKGAALTDALLAAAARGVKVNVIADATSATGIPVGAFHSFKRRIEDAGGEVKVSMGLPLMRNTRDSESLKHVTHRKVVAIDGDTAYTGGINYIKLADPYHDAMVKLTGPNAAGLVQEQMSRWQDVGGTFTAKERAAIEDGLAGAAKLGASRFSVVENSPEKGQFDLGDSYVAAIRGAKERLWLTSPGFSDSKVIDEIKDAVNRGVDVRIVAPGKPPLGVPVINWVGRAHHKELVAAGAKVYEIPEVMHLKALISDDDAILSSYNVTVRSRLHDHEVGVKSSDQAFVSTLTGLIQDDMDRSKQLKVEEMNDVGTKIGNFLVNTIGLDY